MYFPTRQIFKIINTSYKNPPLIYFCKRERLYTKLKYSRVPIYDTTSGGSASLLAGFLGFLISERFGIELVDSGDLYYAYMYVVLTICSLRL